MYISHQGLKAVHDHHIQQCLDRAELRRKMPLDEHGTVPAASPLRRGVATIRRRTVTLRRAVGRV